MEMELSELRSEKSVVTLQVGFTILLLKLNPVLNLNMSLNKPPTFSKQTNIKH